MGWQTGAAGRWTDQLFERWLKGSRLSSVGSILGPHRHGSAPKLKSPSMQKGTPTSDRIGPYRVLKQLSVTGSVQVHLAREDGPSGFLRNVVLKIVLDASGDG